MENGPVPANQEQDNVPGRVQAPTDQNTKRTES